MGGGHGEGGGCRQTLNPRSRLRQVGFMFPLPASKRRGNTLKGLQDFALRGVATIWPWLSDMCRIRLTAVKRKPESLLVQAARFRVCLQGLTPKMCRGSEAGSYLRLKYFSCIAQLSRKKEHLKRFAILCHKIDGHNLALTVLHVPHSLDSGEEEP